MKISDKIKDILDNFISQRYMVGEDPKSHITPTLCITFSHAEGMWYAWISESHLDEEDENGRIISTQVFHTFQDGPTLSSILDYVNDSICAISKLSKDKFITLDGVEYKLVPVKK